VGGTLGFAYSFLMGWPLFVVGARAGDGFVSNIGGAGTNATIRGLVAVTFTDTGIRSGAQTLGYLDMTASATAGGERRVTVNRLMFDNVTGGAIAGVTVNSTAQTYTLPNGGTSAVPEASTSLGLLALGAGGLLTRRRQKRAA
jgi:hypothetical protein